MNKMNKNLKNDQLKFNKESINFSNLIKYWIKLKTIDSNNLNFSLICEKRLHLQRLLFEKGLLSLDTEFLILEQKIFYLISCLDTNLNNQFSTFKNDQILNQNDKKQSTNKNVSIKKDSKSDIREYWNQIIQTNIYHHQTYELIKLNITDLVTQWTSFYNECWIYNDKFDYQLWFKNKFEQFKIKIRTYQSVIVYKLVLSLFNSMEELIKSINFEEKEDYLEILQTILLQLTVEIEMYFKLKNKQSKTTGYELLSILIIKKIALLNSKRCNLNLLNNLPSNFYQPNLTNSLYEHNLVNQRNLSATNLSSSKTNSLNKKRNSVDLIGCLKQNSTNKRKWFADLNDLGLIEVNKNLFEKFTDHAFRTWFQPDEQNSFDSSIDKSVDKSIDKIYDRSYNRNFDKINKNKDNLNTKINSKFNGLINKQQILCLSYQSLQLISNESNSKLIDYLEKVYWNQFWFNFNFQIQHSNLKLAFQSLLDDDLESKSDKINQFHKLLENIKSDLLIEEMYKQFYEFKSIKENEREEIINKFIIYISSAHKLYSNHLIKVNTDRQKTNSYQFIIQIEEVFNTMAKIFERIQQFNDIEELIFILISTEPLIDKIKLIENCYQSEREFNYLKFFNKINIHLKNRLEMLLEYKIGNSINKNYLALNSPVLKPNDWMQKLIDDIFKPILKFKNRTSLKLINHTTMLDKLEQIYIRKLNLFLIKIYDLTIKNNKKSINNFKDALQFYMTWIDTNYNQHIKTDNFPNYFLVLLEQNLNFDNTKTYVNRHQINRNQIAPQYEPNLESVIDNDSRDSFRHVHFKSDIEHKLVKLTNKKSYLKLLFCFDTI